MHEAALPRMRQPLLHVAVVQHKCPMQEVKKESAARHAEAAALRAALRETQAEGPALQPLASMQADLSHLRLALNCDCQHFAYALWTSVLSIAHKQSTIT